jgi:hypothetical protein
MLERLGDAIRFNPDYLAFATHYRFEPRPVEVSRGNEKDYVAYCTLPYVQVEPFPRVAAARELGSGLLAGS